MDVPSSPVPAVQDGGGGGVCHMSAHRGDTHYTLITARPQVLCRVHGL